MRADAKEVRSLQSGLSSRNREKWAEFASFERNEGKNSLQFRLHGGEGGILMPPFLLSDSDPYTSAIIGCVSSNYKVFQL